MCQSNLHAATLAANSLAVLGREEAIAYHKHEAQRHHEQGKGCHPMVADRCDMMSLAHEGAVAILEAGQ